MDAGTETRTVATSALAVRRSNQSARSHPRSARSHPQILSFFYLVLLALQTCSVAGHSGDRTCWKSPAVDQSHEDPQGIQGEL